MADSCNSVDVSAISNGVSDTSCSCPTSDEDSKPGNDECNQDRVSSTENKEDTTETSATTHSSDQEATHHHCNGDLGMGLLRVLVHCDLGPSRLPQHVRNLQMRRFKKLIHNRLITVPLYTLIEDEMDYEMF
ncbi:hypothetical protein LSTR_LSTR013789 [Laodelphax striatellus]|uniref:Uncharacterized protein n=1 Tax=Laodelphax striatellus TaxID=195883 RepID=A0A482XGJ5_LAOST|nr:hypothetical protein LSTR_LSTR013789 [Laodelphax striatellus]